MNATNRRPNQNIKLQWSVESNSSDRQYTVSEMHTGEFQCSCMGWTRHMPRKDCTHIRQLKFDLQNRPSYAARFAK